MTLASSATRGPGGPGGPGGPHALGLARYRSEFPIFRDRIYLNTCSLGPLGERSRRKVAEFLDIWQSRGASAWYDVWWEALGELRARYGRIINAPSDDIALAPRISVALSAVAESLDYIKRVSAAAHVQGALCLIDAYQSVGQIPVDVHETGVDALVAGGLKWLLGGPGIVFLYVAQAVARRLEPRISGWFGQREQFSFDPRALTFHDDARRFEMGTPSLAAVYAQLGGLEYIEELGVPRIRETTAALTEDLIAQLRTAGFKPKVAAEPERRSAIVMVPMPDPAASVRHLAAGGVIADSRPGHVRFSPFFYNVQDDHVRATERLASQPAH